MLLALAPAHTSWTRYLAFNWFDVTLLGFLIFGFWRGRKHGLTKELLPSLQWLGILLAASFGHIFLADWLQQMGVIRQLFGGSFNQRTAALLTAYLTIALLVVIVFVALRRKYDQQLECSNVFGGNEYYWGMLAGTVRYLSMALVALALLNAPIYTAEEIEATKAYNNRWYGGGMKDYSGNFIPALYEVQDSIFKQSLVGPLLKSSLPNLLINSTLTVRKPSHS